MAIIVCTSLAVLDAYAGTLTFNALPPQGKYLSIYQEAGLEVTTRACPETREGNPMQMDAAGRHARFERECMLLLSRSAGSGALKLSEGGTSFYRFATVSEQPFDLVGFDLLSLSGTLELTASSGARLVLSGFNPAYGTVRQDGPPKAIRLPAVDPGWQDIAWFTVQDLGGEALLDNLEFRASH